MRARCSKVQPRQEPWPAVVSMQTVTPGPRWFLHYLIECRNNFLQADIFPLPAMGSRMHHKVCNPQLIAPLHFMAEGIHAFLPQVGIDRGQIDQITVMRNNLGKAQAMGVLFEGGDGLWRQRIGAPLLLVLGKNLNRLQAELFGFEEGIVHAAGDGEMGAKHGGMITESYWGAANILV